MTYTLKPIDDAFFETAPIVIPATVELSAPPERVWEALGSDAMWSWAPIIDQLVWTTGRPQTVGAIRRLRLFKAVTIEEEFYRWNPDPPTPRATFRVTQQSRRLYDGLAEDFLLEPGVGGGTRLTWTMAVAPRLPGAAALGRLAPVLARGNALAIGGIKKIL